MLDTFLNDDAYQNPDSLTAVFFVMEYLPISLEKLLQQKEQIDEEQAVILAYNMLLSVKQLHKVNCIHRDLKPANILLNESCFTKLADFGLSRMYNKNEKKQRPLTPLGYSRYYRPPEIILQNVNYDVKADIWSVGCILYELFCHSSFNLKPDDKPQVLFKGDSCYPISPCLNEKEDLHLSDAD